MVVYELLARINPKLFYELPPTTISGRSKTSKVHINNIVDTYIASVICAQYEACIDLLFIEDINAPCKHK
jgi:hypothetical protein